VLLHSTLPESVRSNSELDHVGKRVVGIDFSGARDAGRLIWIAEGAIDADGCLVLDTCSSAQDRLSCDNHINHILPALVEWIAAQENAIIGCDFPFSLPASVISQKSWHEFVRKFPTEFSSAKEFHRICHERTNGREPKRATDRDANTPWCAFNLQMFYQTYAGIAHLLAPLLGRVTVPPFDGPLLGKPTVVETCPASTLSALGIYKKHGKYKKEKDSGKARAKILAELVDRSHLPNVLNERIVADKGGDALDSVIAAIGAAAALQQIDAGIGYDQPIEGWVYYAGGNKPVVPRGA
jgi:hypothetical protein